MTKFAKYAFIALFAIAAVVTATAADLEKTIGYSGYLREGGSPITGTRDLVFAIYSDAAGGTPLWTETITGVIFMDGEFSVALGSVTPFGTASGLNFHSNTQYYLGITVGVGGAELSPRKKFLFVPYSFSSELELRTSDPASPVTGQMWLRTDL